MDVQNHFYGHGAILSRAAGFSRPQHLYAVVQHGWTAASPLTHFAPYLEGRRPRLPGARFVIWSHDGRGARLDDDVHLLPAVGSPWLYLQQLSGVDHADADADRVVAFPSHSWEGESGAAGHRTYAARLRVDEGDDVLVCLYWRDADDPQSLAAYLDAGFETVTLGAREDGNFLLRQLQLLRRARRVVAPTVQTAIWYAASLGIEVSVLPSEENRKSLSLWPEVFDSSAGSARQAALDELGSRFVRSEQDLRQLIFRSSVHRQSAAAAYWTYTSVERLGVRGLLATEAGAGARLSPGRLRVREPHWWRDDRDGIVVLPHPLALEATA